MSLAINVKIEGLDKIERAFSEAPARTVDEISKAIKKSVLTIERNAKREAPVNKGPGGGTLRQNIKSRMITNMTGEVEAKAPYSLYVHEGTRPHLIRVIRARVLATQARKAPGWPVVSRKGYAIFGTKVKHPGTKSNPFLARGVEKSVKDMEKFFGEVLINVFKTIK